MTGSISLASSPAAGPVKGKTRGDGLLTASRALLRDLQAAFWDVPESKTKKAVVMPAAQLEHHEPAPKLEVDSKSRIGFRFPVIPVLVGDRQIVPGPD
jgi:hypothetical protein